MSTSSLSIKQMMSDIDNAKQNKLNAGTNIQINNDIITSIIPANITNSITTFETEISNIKFVLNPFGETIAWVRNLAMATDTRDKLQHQQMNNQDYALGLKITALETANTSNINNITSNTNNFNTQNTKITNLQNSDNLQNTKINSNITNINSQFNKIVILETNDTNQDSQILSLQTNDTSQNTKINTLETSNTSNINKINTLITNEVSNNTKIADNQSLSNMNYHKNRALETLIKNNQADILELNNSKQDTIAATTQLHANLLRIGDISGFLSPGNLYVEKNIIAQSLHANQHGITISANNSTNNLSIFYSTIANGIDDPLENIIYPAMNFVSSSFDNLNLLNVIAINNDSDRANRFVEIVAATTIKN